MILSALLGVFWGKIKQADKEKSVVIAELKKALEEIKTLSGFLPICASCKKIRDDKGYWNQIEVYISEHSEAEFSHGICPECAKKLYPDILEKYNIKELENKGRYYLAKIANQDGQVAETVLIDKLNRSIHFQKAKRR